MFGMLWLLLLQICAVQGQIYWKFAPNNRAAGQVPSYAIAVVSNIDTQFGIRSADAITFTYVTSLRCMTTGCLSFGTDSWRPFNRLAPSWTAANPAVEPSLNPALAGATITVANLAGYYLTTQNGCRLIPTVTVDGMSLTGTTTQLWGDEGGAAVANTPLASYNGATGTTNAGTTLSGCYHNTGEWIMVYIPYYVLAANPEFPNFSVVTSALVTTGTYRAGGGIVFAGNGAAVRTAVTVQTPWTTTVPETSLTGLQFRLMVPNDRAAGVPNTIANAAVTSLRIGFIPGVQLVSGLLITLEVRAGNRFLATPATAATVAVGPNCALNPLSTYCCTASTLVATNTALVLAGANNAPGWSVLTVTLAPDGCIVPADKYVEFTVPAGYLGFNPATAFDRIAGGLSANGYGFYHVDARLETSAEPAPMLLQRYSETWPLSFLIPSLPTAAGVPTYTANNQIVSNAASTPLASTNQLTLPISSAITSSVYGPSAYVVGLTSVTGFSAAPDTTLTNSPIGSLTITFTTATALPAAVSSPWAYVITATQGIFRAGVGTPAAPLGITVTSPAACNGVSSYFTSPWSTLYFFPVGNVAATGAATACFAALNGGTQQIRFVVPADALLPNPATGIDVRFDIRFVSSLATGVLVAALAGTGDGAALMNQLGWITTAGCSQGNSAPSYNPGGVNDVGSMTYAARCSLVHSISTLSPVRAGIMQCPTGATTSNSQFVATFVKVPEGVWTLNGWPLTNYQITNANWPQSVALTGTPAVVITSWGYMFSLPMYAIVVSYPATNTALLTLGTAPSVPSNFQLVFLVKLNRMTVQCSAADLNNPWTFQVATCTSVSRVMGLLTTATSWTNVESLSGSTWGTGNCNVFVTMGQGGAVAGWTSTSPSPTSSSGSDDALFGLLALIAIPLLLLACLAWALWHFRPVEPIPYAPEYPVQEMYWVNQTVPYANPTMPYGAAPMVPPAFPQAAPMPLSAPPATPIYLVQ